jgi:uncharacterized protein YcaQ
VETLSIGRARRLALGAQGLAAPRPRGRVDRRHVRGVFARTGLLQVDSVNVLVRAQEMPLFTRLGPHARTLLPRMVADAELFEYWGHEASLIPIEYQPLLRWRMANPDKMWRSLAELQQRNPGYIDAVYDEVASKGPLSVGAFDSPRRNGPWWGWHDAKRALEVLFATGRITATRGANFERVYDLPERVFPAAVLAQPTPDDADARRELLRIAARAMGVATISELCGYWRLNVPRDRPLVAELVDEGELRMMRVEGWRDVVYVPADSRVPRRGVEGRLVSPFDPVMWQRKRVERLFGFDYRIEIYVPAPKRRYGYYVLPFLFGDRFVARVDLRADRKRGALEVRGAWAELGMIDDLDALPALAAELWTLAGWLGLTAVEVGRRGDLASALRYAVRQ